MLAVHAGCFFKDNGIKFVSHGMFLNVITPWQPGIYKGLEFPNIKIAVQNFGPIKIMIGHTTAMKTDGEPIISFQLMCDHFHNIASVFACPQQHWVDEVRIGDDYPSATIRTLCESVEFPFNKFILRKLDSMQSNPVQQKNERRAYELQREIATKKALAMMAPNRSANWDMTDPATHNPKDFRYIVHALSSSTWAKSFESEEAKQQFTEGYAGNPLAQPEEFAAKTYISCSVINQNHTSTWSPAGLILDVPPSNIRSAWKEDGTTFVKANGADDYDTNLPDATEVLKNSAKDMWNEVLICGKHEVTGNAIHIAGGFVVKSPATNMLSNPEMAQKVVDFCTRKNLPLVTIIGSRTRRMPVPGWIFD